MLLLLLLLTHFVMSDPVRFMAFPLTFAFPVSAAAETAVEASAEAVAEAASGAEIVGIDYSRITQKADHLAWGLAFPEATRAGP